MKTDRSQEVVIAQLLLSVYLEFYCLIWVHLCISLGLSRFVTTKRQKLNKLKSNYSVLPHCTGGKINNLKKDIREYGEVSCFLFGAPTEKKMVTLE